ncbi:RNA-directed DNA polymerase, eukaryota, reverse transcriptase zinc-binding domain protein, partial [Tanacetum coccineum]
KLLMRKAKIDWLTDGDRNSKYFHTVLKCRAHRSRIKAVNNENEERFEGDRVADQFVQHFKNFLGKSDAVQSIDLESLKCNFVSEDGAKNMVRVMSDVEIKDALYDICDNKAPNPDGYSTKFDKKAWSMVGKEVCEVVKEFFRNGKMLGEVNATLITLVPKSKTPLKVFNYRLIACCNVLYKIISKILTNRIKNALGSLVNPSQRAFIPGRQITNNILLTQELLRGEDGKFRYHWGCNELEISHLYFANDLLVLCHGDANSVKVVKRALDLFSLISGLNLNIVYWASVFILPKLVIKDINKLLKGFLWCHGELSKGKAKVAWKSVCMPKNEGVLGIKDLGQWNETLKAKHLWNIASMKQSL